MSDPHSTEPRSPRPSPPPLTPPALTAQNANPNQPPSTPAAAPLTTGLPPGALIGLPPPGPPPRPNLSSMLFLTAFFFFMSGGNNFPPPEQGVMVGPDGSIMPRVTELDVARGWVEEYKGLIVNGTGGNWTEPERPVLPPSALLPNEYVHPPSSGPFYKNITGFYRDAVVHPVHVLESSTHSHIPASSASSYFNDVRIPNLNSSSWNSTRSDELTGEWDWSSVNTWSMQLKERAITTHRGDVTPNENYTDWTWVKGGITLTTRSDPVDGSGGKEIEYEFYGVHHIPNGTYDLYGLPEGKRIDIRHIPLSFTGEAYEVVREVILLELEKELKSQEDNLLLMDAKVDSMTTTSCPLLVHLTAPPLPPGWTPQAMDLYQQELSDPTGLKWSLQRPPEYWEGIGLGGVAVADGCGWAFGIEGGKGVGVDDFWARSLNYAAFASAAQLLVLLLLVRQMESTRTPSTLAKVSLWTVVLMGIADSWTFSAHVVLGLMSDRRTSLPMLVPGFLCLCTAIVFGPRYAVLLHRIQAPERTSLPTPTTPRPAPATPNTANVVTLPNTASNAESETPRQSFMHFLANHPSLKVLLAVAGVSFLFAILPSIMPVFLFVMFSFWVPQIYRNARRGTTGGFDRTFIIGTAIGRLSLPLYIFTYPDNIFFAKTNDWIWGLVAWQWAQIMMMFAQERFGPAFFLPKRFAPSESYNYHPLFPPPDPENPSSLDATGETTCSICMEEVDIHPSSHSQTESILGLGSRKSYAVAPCHHLFHTKCLAQWLAIKTICPLCKRSLPPL